MNVARAQIAAVLDALRAEFPDTPGLKEPAFVVNLDSIELRANPHTTVARAIAAASKPQALAHRPLRVTQAVVYNGPRGDGVTPNTSKLFLGDNTVSIAEGAPIAVDGFLGLGPCDLSQVYVVSATAGDIVRVLLVL